jgi:hypothetical protein
MTATQTADRGPEEIVKDCNELARQFYLSMGYQVEEGYRFDKARHPQETGMWNMAVMAYEHIESTDVEAALAEIDDD